MFFGKTQTQLSRHVNGFYFGHKLLSLFLIKVANTAGNEMIGEQMISLIDEHATSPLRFLKQPNRLHVKLKD